MSEYYAVQRSGEYLEHYGIKGMKWGVRKAIADGNGRALRRQYNKAVKKLAKLEKRGASGAKSAKKAAAYGAGAVLAGGLAAAGTSGVSSAIRGAGRLTKGAMRGVGGAMAGAGRAATNLAMRIPGHGKAKKAAIRAALGVREAGKAVSNASKGVNVAGASRAVSEWGRSTNISDTARKGLSQLRGSKLNNPASRAYTGLGGVSNNTIARIGAGAVSLGLGAAAARNAYKAATAKRSRQKAAQFKAEMQKAFAGTQYANGAPRQGKKRRRS